jgi:hypothetical protein
MGVIVMTSKEQQNERMEMQQIGAYPTKHKPDEENVPLLQNNKDSSTSKQIPANQDRAQ